MELPGFRNPAALSPILLFMAFVLVNVEPECLPAQDEPLDQPTSRTTPYLMTLKSSLTMKRVPQQKDVKPDVIDSVLGFSYRWQSAGLKRTLFFDELSVNVETAGQTIMRNTMSRTGIVDRRSQPASITEYAKAPAALQAILKDSFDSPIFELTLEENGLVAGSQIVAGKGATPLIEQGMIENARLMHPQIPVGQTSWKSMTRISMGNGGFADGELTYTLTEGGKSGQKVNVTGLLGKEKVVLPGGTSEVQNIRYEVSGSQEFNPASRTWISGQLELKVHFELFEKASDSVVSAADGTMFVTLVVRETDKP